MSMTQKKSAPKRLWRTVLIAAALIAALSVTAGAAYQYYVRQNVPVDQGETAQSITGGGLPSWQGEKFRDPAGGKAYYFPRREVVSTDPAQAQALLGDYLPESGYQWQLEDYTFTVEGYLLDESTGAVKFYYTIEHPGGFGEGAVDWAHGLLNWERFTPSMGFTSKSDGEAWFGGRTYVDVSRSTEEKLCIVDSGASFKDWRAEDGFAITFRIQGGLHEEAMPNGGTNIFRDDPVLEAELDLPGLKSLPAVTLTEASTGKTVLLSAIGLKLDCEDIDKVGYIALEYADGTQYVVRDDSIGLDNSDYGLGSGNRPEMTLRKVFNRLVDPSQVTAVVVDGQWYEPAFS